MNIGTAQRKKDIRARQYFQRWNRSCLLYTSHPAKGHARGCKLHDRVVHTTAAEGYRPENAFGCLPVTREKVKRERLGMLPDLRDRIVKIAEFEDGKQRPKNFFLHDRMVVCGVIDDRRFDQQGLRIAPAAEDDFLVCHQAVQTVVMLLIDNFRQPAAGKGILRIKSVSYTHLTAGDNPDG